METERKPIITGREGGPIAPEVAASWTKNYREKHPGETISQFFGREILERILLQEGCRGIRFYYAYDHNGKRHLVIAGVEDTGMDQVHHEKQERHTNAIAAAPATPAPQHRLYEVGDQSTPCPGSPGCPKGLLSDGVQ